MPVIQYLWILNVQKWFVSCWKAIASYSETNILSLVSKRPLRTELRHNETTVN